MSGGRGGQVVKITDLWSACHEFEPSTTEDPPCGEAMHVKFVETLNVSPFVWWDVLEEGVSCLSLDHGPKLLGTSPKAFE
ncbi:hypothetical protein TNCV_1526031 [Trichonephila clavipes]|nr:hypothetical protein TNCV_1526031 [Trichonephila clavipes]